MIFALVGIAFQFKNLKFIFDVEVLELHTVGFKGPLIKSRFPLFTKVTRVIHFLFLLLFYFYFYFSF